MTKADRAKALRYKRPALASLGYDAITDELYEIGNACAEVHWFIDQDDDSLINALDGDEDDAWEFKMAFADLEAKAEQLSDAIRAWDIRDEFDDCTVALIGNRYNSVGWDGYEEDYYSLTGYEQDLAQTEAGKRLMRHPKAEMISQIGQCFGITLAFMDVRQKYDYLKATLDILRDENTSLLQTIKDIEALYAEATDGDFRARRTRWEKFDKLLAALPDRIWLE